MNGGDIVISCEDLNLIMECLKTILRISLILAIIIYASIYAFGSKPVSSSDNNSTIRKQAANEILKAKLKTDETIFSIGFGPGISIETALFTYAG